MTAPAAPAPIRVLVVDDQELVRSGFCVILDAADGITVVGEAANGEAAVSQAAAHGPDVVLMDIRMPGMDGLEATRLITRDPAAAPKVVMLTTFDLDEYVYEALRAGASGFLLKDSPRHDLIAAVRAAAAGDALLAPSVTRRLIEAWPVRQRGDRQDPCRQPAGEAGPARPGAGGDPRVRDGTGGAGLARLMGLAELVSDRGAQASGSRQSCSTRSWPKAWCGWEETSWKPARW